ncbi:MAG: hypothetical protein JXE06_05640 [Coriobacteriia bacterium]|nr:hypothetical protein [Coriobacteriia bacterium]MBN2822808.1 hypothetical protein [Coriobacteriia bacterium]
MPTLPAIAAPSAAQTAEDRAAVERAVEEYDAAVAQSARIEALSAEATARLDAAIEAESAAQDRLRVSVLTAYRTDDVSFISILFSATTFEDFVTRVDLLSRIAQQDAETLTALRDARIEAQVSAERLLELQSDGLQAVDSLAEKVASAKEELASSEAALSEYQARITASAKSTTSTDRTQQVTGSGAWKTAVASHYGINFTGTGASGEPIGPYTMMIAHKTLPFGTLVEFEYNGKRAVAKVADRGPYTEGRTFDLGPGVIRVLGFNGVHEVRYRIIPD